MSKSMFSLPDTWIMVKYQSGNVKNVANTFRLTEAIAKSYKAEWDKPSDKVIRVSLETDDGQVLKAYNF